MNPEWQTFLLAEGAHFSGTHVAHFGDAAGELQATAAGDILCDLSHLGLLELNGDDALVFLQGQLTNDVKLLNGHNSQYAGYCTPKGRLLALLLAFSHQSHFHLQLDGTLLEPIMKRLKMYVLRSKVTIDDVSHRIHRIGVAGPASEASLKAIFGQVPQQPHELVTLENGALIRLPGNTPRYLVYSNSEHAAAIWKQLKNSHRPVGRNSWEWLEIQAGVPDIVPATQEEFVPQMVNLDALGGISFKKGCYTGQEIVARTHYLGKVKRRTQLAHLDTADLPQPGEDLLARDGSTAGKVVRCAAAPQGGYDLLAELRLESLEAGSITWQGLPLTLQKLPYSLPVG